MQRERGLTDVLIVGLRHAFPRHVPRPRGPDDVGTGAEPADVRRRHGAANTDHDHNRRNLKDNPSIVENVKRCAPRDWLGVPSG